MGHKHKKPEGGKPSRYARILSNKRKAIEKHLKVHPLDKQSAETLNKL
jgi:ribosomal protein S15P/S13E